MAVKAAPMINSDRQVDHVAAIDKVAKLFEHFGSLTMF
jgi:hypothetical protein